MGVRVKQVMGNGLVEGAVLSRGGKDETLPVRGVFIYTTGNKPIVDYLQGQVDTMANGCVITEILVWTAGTASNPLLTTLPCAHNNRGQIIVNGYLEIPDYPGVWVLGDCAEIPNPQTGYPYPPTAQHAIREGKIVAENIATSIRGGSKKQFIYKPLGVLASLGRRSAVAEICGFKFSGFFAWWLWRTIYLFKLPGFERKTRVAMDWTLDLFFPRDIVLLRTFMRKTD